MVQNSHLLEDFNKEFIKSNSLDIKKSFRIFEWMAEEAKDFGMLSHIDPLEDLDVKIKIAGVINCMKK